VDIKDDTIVDSQSEHLADQVELSSVLEGRGAKKKNQRDV
jgi:hypothetical protein